MLRTLLRTGALVSHALVLVVVAVCVWAGTWQLERLDQRRDANALLEERYAAAPVDLDELAAGPVDDIALEFRRVTGSGTYLPDEELVLEGRQLDGQSGRDVFTPLELDDGTLVLVRRGWVPREAGAPPIADAAPPPGEVRLEGYLERSVDEPGFGPRNPAEGRLSVLQIPEVPRIAQQLDGEVFPMIVRLTAQDPPPIASDAVAERGLAALPAIAPVEPLDERNHLSYALQWFSFAVLALIAYGAWWRKRLRGDDDADVMAPDATDRTPERPTTSV